MTLPARATVFRPASWPRWSASLLCLIACGAHEPAGRAPAPRAARPAAAPAAEPIELRMHTEFSVASQARDAIIDGELEQAREPLIWLSTHEFARDLPEGWGPAVQRMQAAAAVGARGATLQESARAVAGVATACGSCHQTLQRGPLFFPDEQGTSRERPVSASEDLELRARMHQHAWIARRLWQGLIGPWDGAWSAGCAELAQLNAGPGMPANLQTRLLRVRKLGHPGCEGPDTAQRAETFARVIAECGECHAALAVHRATPAP